MEKLPQSSSELIRELDKQIPPKCASLSEEERHIWFYAGKRAVVEHLLLRLKKTEGKDSDDDPHGDD